MNSKKILIIQDCAGDTSFCAALAQAYARGAREKGYAVHVLDLADLKFDPILHQGYRVIQPLEPDLIQAQEEIRWADHLVFAFPTWWVTFPALLKGFVDRVFLPGFGFRFRKDSPLWDGLLTGKSARLLVTMDAPYWLHRLIYGAPGIRAFKSGILGFCGVKPVWVTAVGGVKFLKLPKRKIWLDKVYRQGLSGR